MTMRLSQGNLISSILFNLYIYSLLKNLEYFKLVNSNFGFSAYANDLLLFTHGESQNFLTFLLQKALKIAENWSLYYKISFNTLKCKILQITRKKDKKKYILRLNNKIIIEEYKINYLGVILVKMLLG